MLWESLGKFGSACCDAAVNVVYPKDPLEDIIEKNEYTNSNSYFYDAYSIIESSVSSGSTESDTECIPLKSISFLSATSSGGDRVPWDESPATVIHDGGPFPLASPLVDESSSWDDNDSFVTSKENHDYEPGACWGDRGTSWSEDEYDEEGNDGGHDDVSSVAELPLQEAYTTYGSKRKIVAGRDDLRQGEPKKTKSIKGALLCAQSGKSDQEEESYCSSEASIKYQSSRESSKDLRMLDSYRNNAFMKLKSGFDGHGSVSTTKESSFDATAFGSSLSRSSFQTFQESRTEANASTTYSLATSWEGVPNPTKVLQTPGRAFTKFDSKQANEDSPSTHTSSDSTVFAGLEDESVESWGVGPIPIWGSGAQHVWDTIDASFARTQDTAALEIQRCARGHMTRTRLLHQCLERLEHNRAAIKIQDAWLAYRFGAESRGVKSPEPAAVCDTILSSNEGYEVMFGILEPPVEFQRSVSSRLASYSAQENSSDGEEDEDDDDDEEEDLFEVAFPADGIWGSLDISKLSPARLDFLRGRMRMTKMPCVPEEDGEDSLFSDREGCIASPTPTDPSEFDLDLLDDVYESSMTITPTRPGPLSPPRLRRLPQKGLNQLLKDPSHCLPDLMANGRPSLKHEVPRSPGRINWCHVFGIMELACWLQAITRGRRCRRSYLKLRRSVVTLQSLFRLRQRKINSKKKAAIALQKLVRRNLLTERRRFMNLRRSVIRLQKCFRLRQTRNKKIDVASIAVQRWIREVLFPDTSESEDKRHRRNSSCSSIHSESSGRPPLYPGALSPASLKRIASRVQEEQKLSTRESPASDESAGPAPAVKWPVFDTNYVHRTQPLRAQLPLTVPSLERDPEKEMKSVVDSLDISCAESWLVDPLAACFTFECGEGVIRINSDLKELQEDEQDGIHQLQKILRRVRRRRQLISEVVDRGTSHEVGCGLQMIVHEIAALQIQRTFRGARVRRQIGHLLEKVKTKSALEAFVRSRAALQHANGEQWAAQIIQSIVRAYLSRAMYTRSLKAVEVLQKFSRILTCRRAFLAKRFEACQSFEACSCIQSLVRHRAAVLIQRTVRFYAWRRAFNDTKKAACILQKNERRRSARSRLLEVRNAAVQIQRVYQGFIWRLFHTETTRIVTIVQKYERRRSARRAFLKVRNAVVQIQRVYRGLIWRLLHSETTRIVTTLQRFERRRQARTRFAIVKSAVFRVQGAARLFQQRRRYRAALLSVVVIQRCIMQMIRSKLLRKKRVGAHHRSVAATRTRTFTRDRVLASTKLSCAKILRNFFRGCRARLAYRKVVRSTIIVQTFARRTQARSCFVMKLKAIRVIQNFFRSHIVRNLRIRSKAATTKNRSYESCALKSKRKDDELFSEFQGNFLPPYKRKRRKVACRAIYFSTVSIALIACFFNSPVNVRTAQAKPKSALDLQIRALESQVARSTDLSYLVEQRISKMLGVKPMFWVEHEQSMVGKIGASNTLLEPEAPCMDGVKGCTGYDEPLAQPYHSNPQSFVQIQRILWSLVEEASPVTFAASRRRKEHAGLQS